MLILVLSMIAAVDLGFDVVPRASGATIYVYDDPMYFDEIQDAIDSASDGDTIIVNSGTYLRFIINKQLIIEASRDVTIDGDIGPGPGISVRSDWVTVKGFTIARVQNNHGIIISSSHNTISNNIITWCGSSQDEYGIYLTSSAADNQILYNTIEYTETGIYLSSSDSNIIRNNYMTHLFKSIILDSSHYNLIKSNTITLDNNGIYLSYSNYNDIISNTFDICDYPISLGSSNDNSIYGNNIKESFIGIWIWDSQRNTILENNINNRSSENGIALWNADNNNILNNILNGWGYIGIYLDLSEGNNIKGNYISDYFINIQLSSSSEYNHISNNTLSKCDIGIWIRSNLNDINNNTFTQTGYGAVIISSSSFINVTNNHIIDFYENGIYLQKSNNIYVRDNEVLSDSDSPMNPKTILLEESSFSEITNNIIFNNINGVHLDSSGNNIIYHNNIMRNENQAYDDNNSNSWDNAYPSGGNFWSDYNGSDFFSGPNQDILGSDGIGDTPYVIDLDSQDNYPLMNPMGNFTFLRHGWNLVSLPWIQDSTKLEDVLSQLNGLYKAAQWFNASDLQDPWKHYHTSKPSQLNDLDEIDHTMGFQIYIHDPAGAIFYFEGTIPTQNQTIQLHEGWNIVGYPSLTNHNRTVGLNNLEFGTDVDAIQWYDAATKTWHFMGPDDVFTPGRGYWVHSKVDAGWEVPL